MGKEWIKGNVGEFKSAQSKYIEKQEKLEAAREARAREGSFAARARSASAAMKEGLEKRRQSISFPPLLSPSKKKEGQEEDKKEDESSSETPGNNKAFFGEGVQLPDIGKDAEAPVTPKPEVKRRVAAVGAGVSKKRDLMKQIQSRNDNATGWMSSKSVGTSKSRTG